MGYINFNYFQIQYSHTISSNPAMLRKLYWTKFIWGRVSTISKVFSWWMGKS